MARLSITGMSCGHCAKTVAEALENLPGISNVQVSLENQEAVFEADPNTDMEMVKKAVQNAGYQVSE